MINETIICLLEKGFKIHKDAYCPNGNSIYYAEKEKLRLQIQTVWCGKDGLFIGTVTTFSGRGQWIDKPIEASDFLVTL